MKNKGMQLGAVLAAMLLLSMAFVPAVSANKELIVTQKSSELEQGLIDALNSKKEGASTEDIINHYIKSNSDKIKLNSNINTKSDTSLIKSEDRTYKLNNGIQITFTDGDLFYITEVKEENNAIATPLPNQGISYAPTLGIQSMSNTNTIIAYWSKYSWVNLLLFTVYTKGYFAYDGTQVEAHHIDSWYTRGTLSVWQVSNWEEGGYNYAGGTSAEFYGRGNFHYGIEYQGIGLVLEDKYVNLYVLGDKDGNYDTYVEIT